MKILVIIVNYNDEENLNECLESLKPLGLDVYVHDNSRNNLGFAGGINVGLKMSSLKKYDWIWLLNPDCTVEFKGIYRNNRGIFKGNDIKHDYDVFSPVVYNAKGEIWFAGGKINRWSGECTHSPEYQRVNERASWETEWVTGCSMFVKSRVFDKIGFFDEKFFLFYEDVDFCLRAKQTGFRIGVIPINLKVIHKISQSVNKLPHKYEIEIKSKFYLLKKHGQYFLPTAYLISKLRYLKHKLNFF